MSFNFTNDLNCYSLSKSDNVPTSVFDMNHYYTYRQNQGQFIPMGTPQSEVPNSVKTDVNQQHPNQNGLPPQGGEVVPTSRLSKLDLLIQTATCADNMDQMLLLKRSSGSISENENSKKLKLDMNHLCTQAEKVERMDSNSNYMSWMQKKALESKKHKDAIDNTNVPSSSSSSSSSFSETLQTPNNKSTKRKVLSSNNIPTSIKLASPSNNTKRQRSGPSCDCCRSRKIKCDSEIFIMSDLSNEEILNNAKNNPQPQPNEINSFIAHCEFVSFNELTGYQYYKIFKDGDHSLNNNNNNNNKLDSFSYLQFKPCSACTTKNLKCCFSKGFTRNDIIRFNKHERQSLKSGSVTNSTSVTTVNTTSIETIVPISSTTITNIPLSSSSSSLNSSQSSLLPDQQQIPTTKIKSEALNDFNSSMILPTPSPTPSNQTNKNNNNKLQETLISPPQSEKKSNKKTSCKTCRSKKIKCVKTEGSNICVYCIKKSQSCQFE